MNYIKRTILERPNSRLQKYRLGKVGRNIVDGEQ